MTAGLSHIHTYRIAVDRLEAFELGCELLDFYDFACSMNSQHCEIIISAGEELLAPIAKLLAQHGAEFQHCEVNDPSAYMLNEKSRVQLCPGVELRQEVSSEEPLVAGEILVPPGLGWGDGLHPTTRMLATWISEMDCTGMRCIDCGCGSGILGLMAQQRGAQSLLLTDIEEAALEHAAQVFIANNLETPRVQVASLLEGIDEEIDLLIGNLYYDLQMSMAPDLATKMHSGSKAFLSGVSEEHHLEVEAAFMQAGLKIQQRAQTDWWFAYHVSL